MKKLIAAFALVMLVLGTCLGQTPRTLQSLDDEAARSTIAKFEDKKIEDTAELRRALKDMIVDSSNEATQYILDVITHTTGGYELPPKEMEEWQDQRNGVNRYFESLGYTNINVNQKTFCED